MTADDLLTALYGVAIAALGLVSLALGVIGRYLPDVIRTYLENRKMVSLDRAGVIAARATEEHGRVEGWSGATKQASAQALMRSIAPHAAKRVPAAQLGEVVKAGVQQMRASASTPSAETIAAAVRIVSSSPPALPLPPKVPS